MAGVLTEAARKITYGGLLESTKWRGIQVFRSFSAEGSDSRIAKLSNQPPFVPLLVNVPVETRVASPGIFGTTETPFHIELTLSKTTDNALSASIGNCTVTLRQDISKQSPMVTIKDTRYNMTITIDENGKRTIIDESPRKRRRVLTERHVLKRANTILYAAQRNDSLNQFDLIEQFGNKILLSSSSRRQ